jgi:hypothetical protein
MEAENSLDFLVTIYQAPRFRVRNTAIFMDSRGDLKYLRGFITEGTCEYDKDSATWSLLGIEYRK